MSAPSLDILCIPATLERLAEAREFVLARTPAMLEYKVDLVLEELFLNVANYAYGEHASGDVEIACGVDPETSPPRFHLRLADHGRAFDPLALPDPDIHAGLDQREPGGLGVHLVKSMTDSLEYSRVDGTNRLDCSFSYRD